MTPYLNPMRGITLLISVILTTVILSVALALLDITYKQVLLASSSKQSQYAFYNADAAMECALYWDQKADAFGTNPNGFTRISCNGQDNIDISVSNGSSPKITTFSIPCTGGGATATVKVYKNNPTTPANVLFATGYSSCDSSDPRRIERGLKTNY